MENKNVNLQKAKLIPNAHIKNSCLTSSSIPHTNNTVTVSRTQLVLNKVCNVNWKAELSSFIPFSSVSLGDLLVSAGLTAKASKYGEADGLIFVDSLN
jgi:hypothetical protein